MITGYLFDKEVIGNKCRGRIVGVYRCWGFSEFSSLFSNLYDGIMCQDGEIIVPERGKMRVRITITGHICNDKYDEKGKFRHGWIDRGCDNIPTLEYNELHDVKDGKIENVYDFLNKTVFDIDGYMYDLTFSRFKVVIEFFGYFNTQVPEYDVEFDTEEVVV